MPTTITSDVAVEGSTFKISMAFTDSAGNAVAPNVGLNWTLTESTGATVINSRTAVVIAPAETVDIVLSGADLDLLSTETGRYAKRLLTVQGTYDSDEGSGLHIKDEVAFRIINLAYYRMVAV